MSDVPSHLPTALADRYRAERWRSTRRFEGLRGDPEFQRILGELKPRWEALVEWERGLA